MQDSVFFAVLLAVLHECLEQGVCHHLPGLLAVRPLPERSCRDQGVERRLQIALALLFGVHERHACIEQVAEIESVILSLTSLSLCGLAAAEEGAKQVAAALLVPLGGLAAANQGAEQVAPLGCASSAKERLEGVGALLLRLSASQQGLYQHHSVIGCDGWLSLKLLCGLGKSLRVGLR